MVESFASTSSFASTEQHGHRMTGYFPDPSVPSVPTVHHPHLFVLKRVMTVSTRPGLHVRRPTNASRVGEFAATDHARPVQGAPRGPMSVQTVDTSEWTYRRRATVSGSSPLLRISLPTDSRYVRNGAPCPLRALWIRKLFECFLERERFGLGDVEYIYALSPGIDGVELPTSLQFDEELSGGALILCPRGDLLPDR